MPFPALSRRENLQRLAEFEIIGGLQKGEAPIKVTDNKNNKNNQCDEEPPILTFKAVSDPYVIARVTVNTELFMALSDRQIVKETESMNFLECKVAEFLDVRNVVLQVRVRESDKEKLQKLASECTLFRDQSDWQFKTKSASFASSCLQSMAPFRYTLITMPKYSLVNYQNSTNFNEFSPSFRTTSQSL